jgi:alanine racemase
MSREAVKQGRCANVHIIIDTGMGRLGLPYYEASKIIPKIIHLPGLKVEGAYSHFSNANNPSHPKTAQQLVLFKQALKAFGNFNIPLIHIANSDAINNFKNSYFDMVRTGINLYGVFDLQGRHAYKLTPTLCLKSRLIAIRTLPAGFTIGYSCTHTLSRETRVGTVAAGYADGVPMTASNSGYVLIGGRQCPIIGRVSMDYITVNLNSHPSARLGDIVVLIGKSRKEEITVEDWAKIKQSHPYDIICSLGSRVERVYKGGKLQKSGNCVY